MKESQRLSIIESSNKHNFKLLIYVDAFLLLHPLTNRLNEFEQTTFLLIGEMQGIYKKFQIETMVKPVGPNKWKLSTMTNLSSSKGASKKCNLVIDNARRHDPLPTFREQDRIIN